MLKNRGRMGGAVIIVCLIAGWMGTPAWAADDVATMSVDELKSRLGSDGLIILDVRTDRDWRSSEFKIQGARRAAPREYGQWIADLPKDKTVVLYCA